MRDLVEVLPFAIPILVFMIPIVAILTSHQRKMAELMQRQAPPLGLPNMEIESLRAEVRELRARIDRQTIALDSLLALQQPAAQQPGPHVDDAMRSSLGNL